MARTRLETVYTPESSSLGDELMAGRAISEERSDQNAIPPGKAQSAFAQLLALSLKSLSQRAVVALSSLVDLALISSAFVLWLNVMQQPSVLQLVGIGMYAVFMLVVLWLRNR